MILWQQFKSPSTYNLDQEGRVFKICDVNDGFPLLEIVGHSSVRFKGEQHEDEGEAEAQEGQRHRDHQHLLDRLSDWILNLLKDIEIL